jgi:hypothetical protein
MLAQRPFSPIWVLLRAAAVGKKMPPTSPSNVAHLMAYSGYLGNLFWRDYQQHRALHSVIVVVSALRFAFEQYRLF